MLLSQHVTSKVRFFKLKLPVLGVLSLSVSAGLLGLSGCQAIGESKVSQGVQTQPLSKAQKQALDAEAKQTIKPFATELLGTVKSAVASGGHEQAIAACQSLAPAITAKHSGKANQNGWQISRTSTKVRNLGNAPDAWEIKVLADFAKRAAAGEPLSSMDYGEQVGGQYRYAKAIGIKKPCLACHGDSIAPDVSAMLQKAYPKDAATGYKLGELRGMFSLTKKAE